MPLSKQYQWLDKEPGPKMLLTALSLYGTKETLGAGNTRAIMAWANYVGGNVESVYRADSIPWCGLFMAYVAKINEKALPASPLWARAWASWGTRSPQAELGDVLVFVRNGGGHVGLYVGEDNTAYHVLGGNQGDAVSIVRIAKSRCIAVRRSYKVVPSNVRKIKLSSTGNLSSNEA